MMNHHGYNNSFGSQHAHRLQATKVTTPIFMLAGN